MVFDQNFALNNQVTFIGGGRFLNPARGTFLSANVKGSLRGMLTESASANARTAVVTVCEPTGILARPIHMRCKGFLFVASA